MVEWVNESFFAILYFVFWTFFRIYKIMVNWNNNDNHSVAISEPQSSARRRNMANDKSIKAFGGVTTGLFVVILIYLGMLFKKRGLPGWVFVFLVILMISNALQIVCGVWGVGSDVPLWQKMGKIGVTGFVDHLLLDKKQTVSHFWPILTHFKNNYLLNIAEFTIIYLSIMSWSNKMKGRQTAPKDDDSL